MHLPKNKKATRIHKNNSDVALVVEGTNLLRRVRRSYFGNETRSQSEWINDRQIETGLLYNL
jgi:hypothetical protein